MKQISNAAIPFFAFPLGSHPGAACVVTSFTGTTIITTPTGVLHYISSIHYSHFGFLRLS
ncbi:hypothetical protein [Rufibacter sp. LB8]|uniref:hypothetical protein n=1 Tax=Rufibacter sp. LB8 TaxID=2777781 RepID=UPI00178C7E65|nr:hypothetical protein [Rufibacter sp. LB8]